VSNILSYLYCSTALQRARQATSTQARFWQNVRKRLSRRDLEQVDKVVQSYNADHSISSLERLVGEYLPTAENAKDELYGRRQTGGKAVSAKVQKFASTFTEFLGAYSQIMDIMNVADAQFGGVAVQTLSFLLLIAVNKQKKEDLIERLLGNLKNHFPRFRDLRDIYPTNKMNELIARVYADILNFCDMATDYYTKSALGQHSLLEDQSAVLM